jgi:SH3-like domain-containing protein
MQRTQLVLGCLVAALLVLAPVLASAATTTTTTGAAAKTAKAPAKVPAAKTPAPAVPSAPDLRPAPTPPASAFESSVPSASTATTAAAAPAEAPKTFPYAGYINVQDSGGTVYVRAGPGTYYYPLTSLAKDTPVKVVGEINGWSAVAPVAAIYGLVKKADVTLSLDGKSATAAADDVRVIASSDTAKRQWDVMAILKKGDTLKVIGPTDADTLKVAPPEGARVYVATPFVIAGPSPAGTAEIKIEPIKPDPMAETLDKAAAALAEEMKKPVGDRDYTLIMDSLKEVIEKAEKPYIKQNAEARLAEVKILEQRQADFKKAEAIDLALKRRIAAIEADAATKATENTPKVARPEYAAKGMVQILSSATEVDYPIKFKLIDQKGQPIVVLKSDLVDLSKYVGKVVGIRGEKTYLKDWQIYLITVTEIDVLE